MVFIGTYLSKLSVCQYKFQVDKIMMLRNNAWVEALDSKFSKEYYTQKQIKLILKLKAYISSS